MFDRRGTDEGPVSRDQFIFMYTLALLGSMPATRLADSYETDAICCAAGVGTAAVTVTLEGWRKKRGREKKGSELQMRLDLFFMQMSK